MAFVSSFAAVVRPSALRSSSVCGAPLASAPVASRAAVTMAETSASVPFLPKPEKTVGLLGSAEFDPLYLSEAFDIRWMQEAEIKHGRVCMLAIVGFIVQEFVHLPAAQFSNKLATEAFFQGFNPMNMKITDTIRLNEIKNGRLAILGVSGLIHQMLIYKVPVIAGLFGGLGTYPM